MEVEATSRQVASKMSERIYRDPVHNIIRLRTDTDEGELMMRLIDPPGSPENFGTTTRKYIKLI